MLDKRGPSLLLTYIPIANASEKLVETTHTHDKESPVLPHLSKLLVARGSFLSSFRSCQPFSRSGADTEEEPDYARGLYRLSRFSDC
jgi:hypothetical protein